MRVCESWSAFYLGEGSKERAKFNKAHVPLCCEDFSFSINSVIKCLLLPAKYKTLFIMSSILKNSIILISNLNFQFLINFSCASIVKTMLSLQCSVQIYMRVVWGFILLSKIASIEDAISEEMVCLCGDLQER